MELYWSWFQEYLLEIVTFILTSVFIYHYVIEKGGGVKLSKRYRNSVFEEQSKIFLNATQYLISGNKDMAIKEFLNAVDVNQETVDTYFALGGLFRSNGQFEKAISIHRSLIARDNVFESIRLRALKELAKDFDKGGFIDKAIETYKDVLKINRDQYGVIQSLCRIYEDIQDWDQAYNYRIMMNKAGQGNQAETISHILVQRAKDFLKKGDLIRCNEDLEDAFRFAPSVSAKILRIRLLLMKGEMDHIKGILLEFLKENPEYTAFAFESLAENFEGSKKIKDAYQVRLSLLKEFFLKIGDEELLSSPSVVLTKVRLLKEMGQLEKSHQVMRSWIKKEPNFSETLRGEYIKILIELGKNEEAVGQVDALLKNLHQALSKYYCKNCGYNSDAIFWRCPQCHEWETIQFRWKV